MKLLSYDLRHPVSADKILRTNISSYINPLNNSDGDSNFCHKQFSLDKVYLSRKHYAGDTLSIFHTNQIHN